MTASKLLPARFGHSGKFTCRRKLPETNSTNAGLSDESSGPTAHWASIVRSNSKFRRSCCLCDKTFFSQITLLKILSVCSTEVGDGICQPPTALSKRSVFERHPEQSQEFFALFVSIGRGNNGYVQAFDTVGFIKIDLRKDDVLFDAKAVIAMAVKSLS